MTVIYEHTETIRHPLSISTWPQDHNFFSVPFAPIQKRALVRLRPFSARS